MVGLRKALYSGYDALKVQLRFMLKADIAELQKEERLESNQNDIVKRMHVSDFSQSGYLGTYKERTGL